MALTALSSGYDDYAVLRVSGVMGLVAAIALIMFHIPLLPALGMSASGPVVVFLLSLSHSRANRAFSRGPYADLMASRGCHSFQNGKATKRGRHDGKSLSKFLCAERFGPAEPNSGELSGEYIGSTIVLDGELHDVNLQAIIGWTPRDPWLAVLTEEEVNAIRFAMRPSPPIEELLAAKSRGEFMVHDPFGATNLRTYIVDKRPALLHDPALRSGAGNNPLQDCIRTTEKRRATQWAWTVVVGGALPLVFAWALLVGGLFGGG